MGCSCDCEAIGEAAEESGVLVQEGVGTRDYLAIDEHSAEGGGGVAELGMIVVQVGVESLVVKGGLATRWNTISMRYDCLDHFVVGQDLVECRIGGVLDSFLNLFLFGLGFLLLTGDFT